MTQYPNIILVISDTLRALQLGCYDNKNIKTPNIDAFAKESIVFENAHPETLPTIPARRGMHTGRRVFPFHDYKPVKWDIVRLPGWQPLSNDEDTLAENLASVGYYTGFVTDTMPYFAPGFNFTRGFWQWEFIRGKQIDKWRSSAIISKSMLEKYGNPDKLLKYGNDKDILKNTAQFGAPGDKFDCGYDYNLIIRHVANTIDIHKEEDTHTARVFRWASNFIEDNDKFQPFYLLVDCFDPHEPWEAPLNYYKMYADPNYKGRTIIIAPYGCVDGILSFEEIDNIKAHYNGLVSLVDTWFGYFINNLKKSGLWDNSLIILTSDHGSNFGEYPDHVVGKPHFSLYPGVMNIPMIIHLPGGKASGKRFKSFIYNIDAVGTIYDYAGFKKKNLNIDGQSLNSLIIGDQYKEREYLTCRYDTTLWYRDEKYWAMINIDGKPMAIYDIQKDPTCQNNIANFVEKEIINKVWGRILKDANGDIPIYQNSERTDALGRPNRK
ncbi:MAG: sulfatase [Actinobacteria bacterium]|nr:sulfatase [Actinomycetota bacterium]